MVGATVPGHILLVRRVCIGAGASGPTTFLSVRRGAQWRPWRSENRWDRTDMQREREVTGRPGKVSPPPGGHAYRGSYAREEKSVQLLCELGCIQCCRTWGDDEYHVRRRANLFPIQPEVFPQSPLDAISNTSVPSFSTCDDADSPQTRRVVHDPYAKVFGPESGTFLHDSPVFRGTTNSIPSLQSEGLWLRLKGAYALSPFFV